MGMIQPCRCLFISAADYLFQSIVSVLGLLLRVTFDSNKLLQRIICTFSDILPATSTTARAQFISNLARCDRHRLRGYGVTPAAVLGLA